VPSLHYVSNFTHFPHTTLSFHLTLLALPLHPHKSFTGVITHTLSFLPHFTRTPSSPSQDFTVVITHTLSSLTPTSQSQPQVQTTRLIGDTMPLSLPDEDSIQAVLEDMAKLPSPLTHNDPPYTSVQKGGDGALLKFLSQFVEIEEKRATRARDRARFLASQSKQNQKSA
jgi:hypothetical protein